MSPFLSQKMQKPLYTRGQTFIFDAKAGLEPAKAGLEPAKAGFEPAKARSSSTRGALNHWGKGLISSIMDTD
jgi:hypothetical protein